jgi:LCP family protein required for cell wall assembly
MKKKRHRNTSSKRIKINKVLKVILIIACIVLALVIIASIVINNSGKENVVESSNSSGIEASGSAKTYRMRDDLINILILGIDKEENMDTKEQNGYWGQNDLNYLLSIDPKKKSVHLFLIPRDSFVPVSHYNKDGSVKVVLDDELCVQYAWGPDGKEGSSVAVAKDVSEIFQGIPIKDYVAVNLKVFPELAKALGGITVTPDKDYIVDGKTYKAGQSYTLKTAKEIEKFVRYRDTKIVASAEDRADRQNIFMKALKEELSKKIKEDPLIVMKLYNALGDDKYSSIDAADMANLVSECKGMAFDNDITVLPGTVNSENKYEIYELDKDAINDIVIEYFCEPDN